MRNAVKRSSSKVVKYDYKSTQNSQMEESSNPRSHTSPMRFMENEEHQPIRINDVSINRGAEDTFAFDVISGAGSIFNQNATADD